MKVRYGNFIRTTDWSFVNLDHIIEINIETQGDSNHPDTKYQDAFYVEVILSQNEYWVPDKESWTKGALHGNSLQFSSMQERVVFRGTLAECESVIAEILGVSRVDTGIKVETKTSLVD